jgi:UPF0755 protein
MSRNIKIGLFITICVLLATFSFYIYQAVYTPNFLLREKKESMLFIQPGADYESVLNELSEKGIINDMVSFAFLAKLAGYPDKVKPGAYRITPEMTNKDVLRMLINGRQSPVKFTFNNIRKLENFAARLGDRFPADSAFWIEFISHPDTCAQYGFTPATMSALFIPDTYEFYWTVSPSIFIKKMKGYYDKFWNDERMHKAAALHLTPIQVAILASITEAETKKTDEMPIVAGVYINRLNKKMPLQADPTVVFAVGDFTIKRVLSGHKAVDSPYNTYKYEGLPPGPILFPSKPAIDAVLNYSRHDYLFFCAKEDFSGYHRFTADFNEHLKNARIYQDALNKAGIR